MQIRLITLLVGIAIAGIACAIASHYWAGYVADSENIVAGGLVAESKGIIESTGSDGHRRLTARSWQFSDADLTAACQVRRMRTIYLSGTAVTDVGLREVRDTESIEVLVLASAGGPHVPESDDYYDPSAFRSNAITDAGIRDLSRLHRLRSLCLNGYSISDSGIDDIVNCRGLVELGLRRTMITDLGIEKLTSLPSLKAVDLAHTAITDTSVTALVRCQALVYANVDGTRMSEVGQKLLATELERRRRNSNGFAHDDEGFLLPSE